MRRSIQSALFACALVFASVGASARPRPQRTPRPTVTAQPAPPPPAPQVVAQDVSSMVNMLRRLRIYVVRAPVGATDFGALGAGTQFWFVLPSCRPAQPDDPRDYCPIDRLEVAALGTGSVHAGRMVTVLDGQIPRRVQAFVAEAGTSLVRVRLYTPQGQMRYESVVSASALGELPPVAGGRTLQGFEIDFTQYPGR